MNSMILKKGRVLTLAAMIAVSLSITAKSSSPKATQTYVEPTDTTHFDKSGWRNVKEPLSMKWVSKDIHFRQFAVPLAGECRDTTVSAWRGERIGVEALIAAVDAAGPVRVELSEFKDASGRRIDMSESSASFMRYVLADEVRKCGYLDHDTIPSITLPDIIDLPGQSVSLPKESVRPVWCTIEVPHTLAPGVYTATLSLLPEKGDKSLATLNLSVDVLDRTLPMPEDYAFYLDLWQQPYAISRYYGVKPWSKEHFRLLEPYAALMKRAGQKAITAILFYEPWGEQSNDKFEPMVETVRDADGKWHFDFTIFDKYVEFMDRQGISHNIDCFTMVPWQMQFRYIDKKTGEYRFLDAPSSSPQYRELWTAMLTDFRGHLKKKGWFDRTVIFMDERGLSQMRDAISVVDSVDPQFRMGLAGSYHPGLGDRLYNYTLGFTERFPLTELEQRRRDGKVSLIYTCCSTPEPSQFTSDPPADGAYLPVYSTALGYDGYLHWSFQNWTDSPLTDTRFRMFGSGDTFFIYPDGRTSVRYERFVEGVQLSEKIRLLRERMRANRDTEGLCLLEESLTPLRSGYFSKWEQIADVVNGLESKIEKISRRKY